MWREGLADLNNGCRLSRTVVCLCPTAFKRESNVVGRMVLVGDVVDKVAIFMVGMANPWSILAQAATTVKGLERSS
jgi:hypothetical protein